jgi:twitching motility protein PilT
VRENAAALTEIMGSSLRTRETIVYGESENKTFHEIIEAGSSLGWQTFDQSIIEAYQAGLITEETVLVSCTNKGRVRRELDSLQKQRGAHVEQVPSGLKLSILGPIRHIHEDAAPAAPGPPGKR